VLVGGDTTPHTKPHPAPLLRRRAGAGRAARPLRVYVGDDLRDMQAGRAAGMATLAAAWGYLGRGEPVEHWGADAC
jgi:N-acetyl-D-muramate 6-phosphate phosphatase